MRKYSSSTLKLSILTASLSILAGCGNDDNFDQQYIAEPLATTEEQEELRAYLAEAQAKDPSIVDAYFTEDENGNRVVELIRENPNATSDSDRFISTMLAAGTGVLLGSLIANAMSGMGKSKTTSAAGYQQSRSRAQSMASGANRASSVSSSNRATGSKASTNQRAFNKSNSGRSTSRSAFGG